MNIIDFVKINGHRTFDEFPFNEVDALVLAQLAYLNYNNISTSFNDVIDSLNLNAYETSILLSKKEYGHVKENERLIREVLSSKRYYGIKFGHYLNVHSVDKTMQFCAITFIFEKFICISYMGTDATILGWKEDFTLSYKDDIPSQTKGLEYYKRIASLYDKDVYLTGHSKGGNIAIYTLSKSGDIKIVKAYSFDAPGFNKNFVESQDYLNSSSRMEVYVPESSFIGLIMYNGDDYKIVASNKAFYYQHNIYNWLVNETGIILKDSLSKKSLAFDETNKKWLESFSDEEREIFFDMIFELLEYNESRSFLEIKRNWKSELNRIIQSSKKLDEESKTLMKNITKSMFANYIKFLFSRIKK